MAQDFKKLASSVVEIQNFTEIFSHVMPGEFKGFDKADLHEALRWAAT